MAQATVSFDDKGQVVGCEAHEKPAVGRADLAVILGDIFKIVKPPLVLSA